MELPICFSFGRADRERINHSWCKAKVLRTERGSVRLRAHLLGERLVDVDRPATRYAKTSDGVHIAYQVIGEGPSDLVFVPGFAFNVEHAREGWPIVDAFLRRLASFSRLVIFDRRGPVFPITSFREESNPSRSGWTTSEP